MAPKRQATTDNKLEDGLAVLHRSSFIEWKPSPVISLSSSADGSLTVAARENGDLELYETATSHCFQRIPGSKDSATTCVAVVDESGGSSCRVFTAGLDGAIAEVDLEQRRVAAATDSYGGAVWQLALEPAAAVAASAAEPVQLDAPQQDAAQAEANGADAATAESGSSGDDSEAEAEDAAPASPRLAAACDDGCVRLFSVEPGVLGASYAKSLPRVEGRALAVAWHPTGRCLVSAGTDGCIHVWDVGTGRELLRISAGDASGKEACVWSLLVLPDGTIVSGDSSGNVSFWDARFGTLLARFQQHRADVLQLAASSDGATVFAAGVDPQIAVFQRVKGLGGGNQEWAFLSAKRPHTHDVRAMCVSRGKVAEVATLWTGGNDTVLMTHSVERFLKEHPARVDDCPQRPMLQAEHCAGSGAAPWLLCAQGSHVDLWQLRGTGEAAAAGAGRAVEGGRLPAAADPLHLARIVNRSGAFIASAALSQDGSHVAFSDAHRLCCFAVAQRSEDADSPVQTISCLSVSAVQLPEDLPPAVHLAFQPGSNTLVSVAADGIVRLISPPGTATDSSSDDDASVAAVVVHTIRELHDLRYKMWHKRDRGRSAARRLMPAVDLIALSRDGRWLAAAVRGRVQLLGLDSHRIAAYVAPAAEHSPLAALAFTGDSAALVTVSAANQVATFDVPGGQPSEWTLRNGAALPQRLLDLPGPIAGIAANPAAPAAVLLFSASAVCHLDFGKPLGQEAGAGRKQRRRERGVRNSTPAGTNCRALYCSDPVLHVQYLGGGRGPLEVLVVERAWADVWRGLPPPLYRHRYGA